MRRPALTIGVATAGLLCSITACGSSHHADPSPSVVITTASPTSTATVTTSVTELPSTAESQPSTADSTAPPSAAGCSTAGLAVTVDRGSGASGQVVSTITFTNNTASSCTLTGYPGVSLLLAGTQIGQPATRTGAATKTVPLAPGASVTSTVTDTTTCNASESDSMRIYPPNQTAAVAVPIALRACSLTVTPVASA